MVTNSLTTNVGVLATDLKARNISGQTWKVLKETIFPNAKDQSILMALDYCKVRGLDILKKPVHIVPIWDKEKKCYVDTVWQGISEIRTTAMRTKEYAGIDETLYGKTEKKKIGGVEVSFPEFAQATVYRLIGGQRVAFVGEKVYWLETYAKTKDGAPNSMWQQRPFGQIAKCAEAAALRRAFPEEIGNDYIAEEMEGKTIDANLHDIKQAEIVQEPMKESQKENTEVPDPLNNFD